MFVGLDEGIERAFDDGLRHFLAIGERLIGPRLLRSLASHRGLGCRGRWLEQNIGDADGKRARERRRNPTTGQRCADDRHQRRARRCFGNEIIGECANHARRHDDEQNHREREAA